MKKEPNSFEYEYSSLFSIIDGRNFVFLELFTINPIPRFLLPDKLFLF